MGVVDPSVGLNSRTCARIDSRGWGVERNEGSSGEGCFHSARGVLDADSFYSYKIVGPDLAVVLVLLLLLLLLLF
jgi:hypothetical protein